MTNCLGLGRLYNYINMIIYIVGYPWDILIEMMHEDISQKWAMDVKDSISVF